MPWEMVVDWLAAGVDPSQATIFIQSKVPEHAELHLLLSMMTPLGWLERVPTYKDQQEKLTHKDLTTYGFLGYPLLQAADILIYRANQVPVGEDQVPHVEFTREIARRFNHLYGREPGFEDKAREAVKKLGSKRAKLYDELRTRYQEKGEDEALEQAHALLNEAQSLSHGDRERLFGWLEGSRKMILVEPGCAADRGLAHAGSRWPEDVQVLRQYHHPARGCGQPSPRRSAPCRPTRRGCDAPIPATPISARCGNSTSSTPTTDTRNWVIQGCKSAGIGCLECKQPVIDAVLKEQDVMRERAQPYLDDPSLVRSIVADGCDRARKLAQETMREVRDAMGLSYN
jgi:tryptophanyl-tRNA synthetase